MIPFSEIIEGEKGFFAAHRGEMASLIKANPLAYVVAAVIASRAKWNQGFNPHGLEQGEAMMGDYKELGMTRQQYRTALAQLVKWKFATIRATNKGTVAKLIDTRLFSLRAPDANQQSNQRLTTEQPATNQQLTTNEQGNKETREQNKTVAETPLLVITPPPRAKTHRSAAVAAPASDGDEQWITGLTANPAYRGIDVEREYAKMLAWCQANGKQPTRRRFINWLNRAERPMTHPAKKTAAKRFDRSEGTANEGIHDQYANAAITGNEDDTPKPQGSYELPSEPPEAPKPPASNYDLTAEAEKFKASLESVPEPEPVKRPRLKEAIQ